MSSDRRPSGSNIGSCKVQPLPCAVSSFDGLQKLLRFAQQIPNLPALSDRFPGKQPVPACIPVSFLAARSLGAAVHAAARLAAHRCRAARSTGAGFGAVTRARQQLTGFWRGVGQACALRSGFVAVRQPRTMIRCGRADLTSMSGVLAFDRRRTAPLQAISGSKLPDAVILQVICPTCQNVFRRAGPWHCPRMFAWARFRVFWLGLRQCCAAPNLLRIETAGSGPY